EWLRLFPGRRIAATAWAGLAPDERALLEAYSAGVNAGLAALGAAPPEYVRPGTPLEPWKPEDCFLVGLSMWFNLQDSRGDNDESRDLVRRHLPADVVDFLFTQGSAWDAPLDRSERPVRLLPVEAWAAALRSAPAPVSAL